MGFDNECILNIQSLAGEYFCPVCRLLVYPNEALQSRCTHLYCKSCLTYIVSSTRACPYDGYLVTEADSKPLAESNKALAETIGKIKVHCLYNRSGCTWQGSLSDSIAHCSGCAFGNSPVVCNRCAVQIVHRQVHEHAQTCTGAQSQAQHTGVQSQAQHSVAAPTDQSKVSSQTGSTGSQVPASQTPVATVAKVPNQQANPTSQAQAIPVQSTALTTEQWQQQQYQQYYQQYPGYDAYQQQYQQYYYQQQAVPAYQNPQMYGQPQAPQLQVQPQPQPQPQPQTQPHSQQFSHPQVQLPFPAQPQNQVQVTQPQQIQDTAQLQVQSLTHPQTHSYPNPQIQPPVQSDPLQSHPQHMQIPQLQNHVALPFSVTQHLQPQTQSHAHVQLHTSQIHSQAPVPTHVQQTSALSQPQISHTNNPLNANPLPQAQHPAAHSVTGFHSYPQPQVQQPIKSASPRTLQIGPQGVNQLQPQNFIQNQNQFPQQPPVLRPPQSHAVAQNQQTALLNSPGQLASIRPPQQQPFHSQVQQLGHVHHRSALQPFQQSVHQQYMQQQPPFPGQQMGPAQNQGHQVHMQSHIHPQVDAHSHGMQRHLAGRSVDPQLGMQLHTYPHSKDNQNMVKGVEAGSSTQKSLKGDQNNLNVNSGRGDILGDKGTIKSGSGQKPIGNENHISEVKDVAQPFVVPNGESLVKQVKEEAAEGLASQRNTFDADKKLGLPAEHVEVQGTKSRVTTFDQQKQHLPPGHYWNSTNQQRTEAQQYMQMPGHPSGQVRPPGPPAHISHHEQLINPLPEHMQPMFKQSHGPEVMFPGSTKGPGYYGPQSQLYAREGERFSDQRFRSPADENLNPSRQFPDRREFEEDPQLFPGRSHLNPEPVMKFGNHMSVPWHHDRVGFGERPGFHGGTMIRSDSARTPGYDHRLMDVLGPQSPAIGTFSRHLRRGELDGSGGLPVGEHMRSSEFMGLDGLPNHLRRGELLGPHNMPSHFPLRESVGPGSFQGADRYSRFGEPGFRSSFSLKGFPGDGGSFTGDLDSYDNLRKRKTPSMGWCRICKVDCETLEGMEMHSQTREHQNAAIEIVATIKKNAKLKI